MRHRRAKRLFDSFVEINFAESIGPIVRASKRLMSMTKQTVRPNSFRNFPAIPPTKAIGPKTAMIASVVAITASITSFVPSSAATAGSLPICIWRKIFSRTTIASSTRRPTARERASRVSILTEKPAAKTRIKAPISELGKAKPVITVDRTFARNKKTTIITSTMPIIIDSLTSNILFLTAVALSLTIRSFEPFISAPNFLFISISRLVTREATSTVLEPFCL